MTVQKQLATGLGGAVGSDFRSPQAQLLFVEFNGNLSRLNLFPAASQVSAGTTVLKGTWTIDLETGALGDTASLSDLWWEQQTNVDRQMTPWKNAQIVNLGAVDFNALTPAALRQLTYGTTPINGDNNASNQLVNGDVFAVRTNQGNYAKVKVVTYGYNMTIQWVTYHFEPAYAVIGTGYQQPEDVKVSVDGAHAYVTERTGSLLRVALNNANRAAASVVSGGMTAPHQIFLDEAHGAAYVVEYASPGHLFRVNLANGARTAIVANLEFGIGLVLSADLQYAYVTEQTTGPDQGRVSRITLSTGVRETLAKNLAAPFMLTWADAAQTTLLVADRDPANRVISVSVTSGAVTAVATGLPARPSSAAVIAAGDMLVCCNSEIDEVAFGLGVFQPGGPLLMGIGNIPFDRVKPSGLADTSVDPTYFYQVKDTPFGGTLPIMVNHQRAANDGAAYYRIKVDGAVRTDSWVDYWWNGTQYIVRTTAPTTVSGQPGYYPVHSVAELFLWFHPALGSLLDSTNLANGPHDIVLEFTNGVGAVLEAAPALHILVNNQSSVGTLSAPVLNGVGANPTCGVLKYAAKNSDQVFMPFTASHPAGFATFSFSLIKGVNGVALPAAPPTSGPVAAAVSPFAQTVANLLGACNVAGFAEYLYVAATANNGWSRQSQYDASAAVAFVLAPLERADLRVDGCAADGLTRAFAFEAQPSGLSISTLLAHWTERGRAGWAHVPVQRSMSPRMK